MVLTFARSVAVACVVAAVAVSAADPARAAGVPGQGTWETTLQPRDLDGNGVADAFYDTDLNVTWLRNANVNGLQFRDDAKAWADNLVFGGYSDWRLPTMIDTGKSGCDWAYGGTDCGYNVQTQGAMRTFSEMEHLFRVTLGNTPYCDVSGTCEQPGWGLSNTGDFQNMQAYFYWSGLSYGPGGVFAWYYYTPTIYQSYGVKLLAMYALAVRPGDVTIAGQASVVPEPAESALMLLGLGVLGLRLRRRAGRLGLAAAAALALAGPALADGVPGQGTWETTLQPRDLDGNGVTDAFYDTDLNITWLRDANMGGLQFWAQANTWAADLTFGGYTDWRLPIMIDTNKAGCNFGYSGTDCGYNVITKGPVRNFSELGHLFTVTLANKAYCDTSGTCNEPGWGLTNTGNFLNMGNSFYWTSVEYVPNPDLAWYFYAYSEYQSFGHKNHLLYALAVRDGDVGLASASPVPEPASSALMLAGLALLTVAATRRR